MVVAALSDMAVDHLFHALADATRRDILRRSTGDEPSVSRLAEAYPMSFAAVQKHVAVLERAGLVTKERRGRKQLVRTDPEAIRNARLALDQLEAAWRAEWVGCPTCSWTSLTWTEPNRRKGTTDERHQR